MKRPLALRSPNHLYFAQHHSLRVLGVVTREDAGEKLELSQIPHYTA